MNSNYREFMQRQKMNGLDKTREDDVARQVFGDAPDMKHLHSNTPKKRKEIDVENIPIPVNEGMIKKGYIAIGIILLIEAIFLLINSEVMSFIGGTFLAVFSFLLAWKVKYRYTKESNFFFYHLTVTLKGVLNHHRTTSILLEGSEKIFIYSIGVMAVQYILLSWFSLSSVLYSFGYYVMFLGIVLNFAKRKTELLYKGLSLYCGLLLLMTLLNTFGSYHYVNYHTVITILIFWYLAGLFQTMKISEVHIDYEETKNDLDINSQNDNLI